MESQSGKAGEVQMPDYPRRYFVLARGDEAGDPLDLLYLDAQDGQGRMSTVEVMRWARESGLKATVPPLFNCPRELVDCRFLVVFGELLDDDFVVWALMPLVPLPKMEILVLQTITAIEKVWMAWQESLDNQDHRGE